MGRPRRYARSVQVTEEVAKKAQRAVLGDLCASFALSAVKPISIALFLLFSACGGEQRPLEPTFQSIQRNVFDVHCARAGCHVGAMPESGLNLERGRAYAQLINQPSLGIPDVLRVVPGDAARSYLMRKLEGRQIVGERMPMGEKPLPDSLLAVIRQWIDEGAEF